MLTNAVRRTFAIVVIDDNREIASTLERLLAYHGHAVTVLDNGRTLPEHLSRRRVDLVITDVVMPDCDGFELIDRLRQLPGRPRILAMTGGGSIFGAADCARVARMLGADAALLKPFAFDALTAAMDELLGDAGADGGAVAVPGGPARAAG